MRETFVKIVLKNFFKVSFAFILLSIMFYIMMPFMISIVLGGILAMALSPFVDYLMRKGLSRGTSLVVFSIALGIVGFIPVVAFFIRGSRIITNLLHNANLSEMSLKFITSMHNFIDRMSKIYGLDKTLVDEKINGLVTYGGTLLSSTFSSFVAELPVIFMLGFITLLSVYCFLKESEKIRELFDRYFFFSKENGDNFIHMLKVCCREVFFSNIITGTLQASIVSIGALVFGVGDFFLVFFITYVFSFIPIIGAAPVAASLGVACFIESRVGAGIGMMVIAGVSGLSDNIIRPFLGSLGEVEVHPFIGLLAVIGGVIMFGLPGLFIGPLVASLIFGALPIIVDEYFPPSDT